MKHEFIITDEQMKNHALSLMEWGSKQKLEPAELALVLKMTADFLAEELGLSARATEHETQ